MIFRVALLAVAALSMEANDFTITFALCFLAWIAAMIWLDDRRRLRSRYVYVRAAGVRAVQRELMK